MTLLHRSPRAEYNKCHASRAARVNYFVSRAIVIIPSILVPRTHLPRYTVAACTRLAMNLLSLKVETTVTGPDLAVGKH